MADRGFPTSIENALSSDRADLALLVYLDWPSGAVRVWTGVGDLAYDSNTWSGAGELGSIDKIGDALEAADIGVELTLNYLDDDLRNEILTNDPIGADASITLALLDVSAGTVTAGYEIFSGFIDEVSILDGGDTGQIVIRLASELARLRRPVYYQLSSAHQQFLFSGDLGLEFAPRMGEPILWGAKPTIPINVYNAPGPIGDIARKWWRP